MELSSENGDLSYLVSLLRKNDLFGSCGASELLVLANMLEKLEYPSNTIVVREGDLGGDIYFVAEGRLTLSEKISKKKLSYLGKLEEGDCIGLSATGFYSQTGLRRATVTTLEPSILFCLKIEKFVEFLKHYTDLYESMRVEADHLMRAKFIKEAMLFSSISPQQAQAISQQIQVCHIEPNTIVLKEGEMGDNFFLIRSGELVVSARNDQKERVLSNLAPPMVFGETSLLTQSPRNATVRSTTACELFMLGRETFLNIIKQERKVRDSLSPLVIDRSRPKKNPDVKMYFQKKSDGELIAVLKNEKEKSYYRLSRVGIFIWQLLDGKTTLQEITTALFEDFSIFSPDTVSKLITDLYADGFVEILSGKLKFDEGNDRISWLKRQFLRITEIMEYQYSFKAVDRTVTSLYQSGGYLLFKPPVQLIFVLLIIAGVFAFFYVTPQALMAVKSVTLTPIIIALVVFNFLSIAMHELAHALATKAFGFQVHRFGIGWYWVGGIAFTDTSDMWLSTRWPRTVVNFAGVYADLIMAGIVSCLAFWITDASLVLLLWAVALSNYINVFKNLDPTLEFDGYYILIDLMDRPNLRESSVVWLINLFSKNRSKKNLWRGHQHEILYWLACIVFLVISVEVTIFLQTHVTKHLFPSVFHSDWYTYFLQYGIPILVTVLASFGIWAEVARQKMRKVEVL